MDLSSSAGNHDLSVSLADLANTGCGLVTCATAGATCGPIGDGCGGVIQCGDCTSPKTCGGGGTSSVCGGSSGCIPITTCPTNVKCGPYPDGCGALIPGGCGTCTNPGEICGGGGPSKCGPGFSGGTDAGNSDGGPICTPAISCPANVKCGPWGDGCGGLIAGGCGICTAPQSCGGGSPGSPGVCGGFQSCVIKTCTDYPNTCGQQSDGCGGLTVNCGTCISPDTCGGGGPSKCGNPAATGGCTGLCPNIRNCGVSPVTSISGTVYAPTDSSLGFGNPDPINRAVVYIPNGAAGAPYYGVTAFTPGVSCDKCGAAVSGPPLSDGVRAIITQTGINGKFKLDNVPVMANLPLVIQVGRWRRMITIPTVTACQDNPLSAEQTRLPRSHTEAGTTVNTVPVLYSDIPRIGFDTGNFDPMECVLRKIGIADSEFNDPAAPLGTGPTDGHRVDFYVDNGASFSGATPAATSLYDNLPCVTVADCPAVAGQSCNAGGTCAVAALSLYDMVVFACVGGEVNKTLAEQTNLTSYTDLGGRFFATHFSYVWLYGNPTGASCTPTTANEFTPTATWSCAANQADPTPNPMTAYLDQSFPKGVELANWLQLVLTATPPTPTTLTVALTAGGTTATVASTAGFPTQGTLLIGSEQITYTSLRTGPPRFRGLTRGANGTTAAAYAVGAAVSLVVAAPPFGQIPVNDPRHNMDAVAGPPTSQQWASRNAASPPDTPKSVAQTPMHYTFNTPVAAAPADQCGRAVYSDFHVYAGVTSGGTTFPAECGNNAPMNAQEKLLEFMLFDLTGCVTADQCIPKKCSDYGYTCGQWPDGCGGVTVSCGPCTGGQTCGGGGVLGHCGGTTCTKQTCTSLGYACGVWGDGCGGVTANCGTCTGPAVCGGGGQCVVLDMSGGGGCNALTCMQQNIGCGPAGNGCGVQIDCGKCTPPATCGGGGVASQCGMPMCTPKGCPAGANCGVVADGCGGTVSCGTCTPPQTCGGQGIANVCGGVG